MGRGPISEPASLGRVRGIYRNRFGAVLVNRPDPIATMRDRSKTRIRQMACRVFALGWRGSVRQWHHYETAYLILAALATPRCSSSVHSDRLDGHASRCYPDGAHGLPAYFIAGAIFSGFAGAVAHGDLPLGLPPRTSSRSAT
jgi:hypothetical protein